MIFTSQHQHHLVLLLGGRPTPAGAAGDAQEEQEESSLRPTLVNNSANLLNRISAPFLASIQPCITLLVGDFF